jgi:aspartyl-tRNA(Asn)/glutamyl-tRNA(Gln) amidotransferase subunit C
MAIDRNLILRLERLAMLELSEEERTQMQSELNDMLSMISKLEEIDTTNVPPLIHLSEAKNIFREDKIQYQVTNKEALKNAPNAQKPYFKVPKVIK